MRTIPQNKSYWLLIVEPITAFYSQNNGKLWRDVYKSFNAYLPAEYEDMVDKLSQIVPLQVNKDFVHNLLKELFNNGQSTRFVDSPDKKATVKMQEYVTKVTAYYAVYGLELKEPGELEALEFIQ